MTISQKLGKIKRVFNLEKILELKLNDQYIQNYYSTNWWAYSLFHNFSDQVHMGISRDGKYKKADLFEAARIVEKYIDKTDAQEVLELAIGRGATLAYLAKRHPEINFQGIELTQKQLNYALKKLQATSYPIIIRN